MKGWLLVGVWGVGCVMFFVKSYDVAGTPRSDNCSHHVNHVNAIDFVPAWHKDLARYVDLYIYIYIFFFLHFHI